MAHFQTPACSLYLKYTHAKCYLHIKAHAGDFFIRERGVLLSSVFHKKRKEANLKKEGTRRVSKVWGKQTGNGDIFLWDCCWFSFSPSFTINGNGEMDWWETEYSFPAKCFHCHQMASNNESEKQIEKWGCVSERDRKRDPAYTLPVPPGALRTPHPVPPCLWWKGGRNLFQFGQWAPVLLKAIEWLNRGTIS